jgi:pyruvate formate lyase activating enzyme
VTPLVLGLRRFALDDGPGIRTTVFLKGCPLACAWCHNPEAISPQREVTFHAGLCVRCGECEEACPAGAVDRRVPGRIDRRRCDGCGRCADACPSTALRTAGEDMSVEALTAGLLRDRPFFEASGGGATLSGGEPTMHLGYVAAVARALKREGIHVVIQTCGVFDLERFRAELLPWVDLVHFDLKLADPEAHRRHTGSGNDRIVENFRALARETPERVVPRVPLVPGITATRDNLSALGQLVRASGCARHELLPWNPAASAKRALLGEEVAPALQRPPLRVDEETSAAQWFAGQAHRPVTGGSR